MAEDDDAIAKRIRDLRAAHKLSQLAFAEKLGVTRGAVGNWERGKGIKRENLIGIAEAFGRTVDWLATGGVNEPSLRGPATALSGTTPPYAGVVQAGMFLPVNDFNQDPEQVPDYVRPHPAYRRIRQYAWQSRGDSMVDAGIEDGMWIVGADAFDYIDQFGDIESGDLVVVERTRYQGAERELTVKEIRYYRDRYELHPRSPNKAHQPIIVPHDNTVHDLEVRVLAKVLTAYRDFTRPNRH